MSEENTADYKAALNDLIKFHENSGLHSGDAHESTVHEDSDGNLAIGYGYDLQRSKDATVIIADLEAVGRPLTTNEKAAITAWVASQDVATPAVFSVTDDDGNTTSMSATLANVRTALEGISITSSQADALFERILPSYEMRLNSLIKKVFDDKKNEADWGQIKADFDARYPNGIPEGVMKAVLGKFRGHNI